MGLIFAKLWSLFGNQEHKVIIVGLDNAGKTTILYQFLMNEVVHTSPTIGSNVEEIVVKNTHFLMWDIGGQESLRSSWNTYYSNTEFIILVVDSIDRERLSITKEELYRMLAHEIMPRLGVDDLPYWSEIASPPTPSRRRDFYLSCAHVHLSVLLSAEAVTMFNLYQPTPKLYLNQVQLN